MTGNQASPARAGLPASQATSAVSISAILGKGDIVTGVRGTTDGNVILTGSHATGTKKNTLPFLYQGPLTSAAKGISALPPRFRTSRRERSTGLPPTRITRTPSRQAKSVPSEATGRTQITVSSTTA